MKTNFQDMTQISSDEVFTEEMAPTADWANEPEMPSTWREAKTGGFVPPVQNERCEDAPCCGCCPASSDFELDANNDDHWTSFDELRGL